MTQKFLSSITLSNGSVTALAFTTVQTTDVPPAGTNTQVQFNDAGSFGGSANFTFDKSTGILTVNRVGASTRTAELCGGSGIAARAAYFTDGVNEAYVCDGSESLRFVGLGGTGSIGASIAAGVFFSASIADEADVCDGTYALNARGDGSGNNGKINANRYYTGGVGGASGTFTTVDGKTVTVTKGIITSIV